MANESGYGSYRGRRPLGKILLVTFLILVIAAAGVFLALQKYMVYDADGNLRLEFPKREGTTSKVPPISSEDLNIIIDRKEPTEKPEEPEQEPAVMIRGGVQLPDLPLTDWSTALERVRTAGAELVCLTVKDGEGTVYVDSTAAAALSRRIVAAKSATEQAVADMVQEESLASIAKIACLRDPRVPILDVRALGLRQRSGYLFYDDAGVSWLDPTKDAVLRYLTGLVQDCADMGFDEILLTDVAYPAGGETEKINHGEKPKDENLADFIRAMRTALKGYDVKLSLELPAAVVLEGSDSVTGQSLSVLAPLVDRIYVRTTAAEALQLAEQVKLASPDTGFVAEVTDAADIAVDYLLVEE